MVEWTEAQQPPSTVDEEYWVLYFDWSLMRNGAGAGLVFVSPLGVQMKYTIRLNFQASNNMAEYEAIVNGLRIASELGIRRPEVRGDSQLVVTQVMKEATCRDVKMAAYC